MEALLISLKEASESLSVSVPALREWIKAGKIPAVRLGRRVLISRKWLIDISKVQNPDLIEKVELTS